MGWLSVPSQRRPLGDTPAGGGDLAGRRGVGGLAGGQTGGRAGERAGGRAGGVSLTGSRGEWGGVAAAGRVAPAQTLLLCHGGLATANWVGSVWVFPRPAPPSATTWMLSRCVSSEVDPALFSLISKAWRSTAGRGCTATAAAMTPRCRDCDCPWD